MILAFLADPELRALLRALGEGQARIIGGAVRDALMGRVVADVDLATPLPPDEVMARLVAAGVRAVPTGLAHGTITAILGKTPFEITTLRADRETDGRHAVVEFGAGWEEDARRRDFTINALSVDASGHIFDYVGGLADITQRKVRFIGDAAARIREDYLRILRFFRFHALCGEGPLDAQGLKASHALRKGLATLSRERVRSEWLKLLAIENAAPVVEVMAEHGILPFLITPVCDVAALSHLARVEQLYNVPPDALRRLAALAVRNAGDAVRLSNELHLSNAQTKRLTALADNSFLEGGVDETACRRHLYLHGPDLYRDHVLLAVARRGGDWNPFFQVPQRWTPPVFPITGKLLLERGMTPGKAMGDALRDLREEWIAAGYPSDWTSVERLLKKRNIYSQPDIK